MPHEALVRSRVAHLCNHDLSIEDVIQEMYARILSLPSFDNIHHPKQYAVLTAKSVIIDYMRRSRVVSIKYCDDLERLEITSPEASAEERLQFLGEIEQAIQVLALLPPRCRETLILRRVEGLSQNEAARRMNVSEKMIEKQMARGARALAEFFCRGGNFKRHSSSGRWETRLKNANVELGD
jgi:RNA polymerase sigma-70 factor (ECF subfamily)